MPADALALALLAEELARWLPPATVAAILQDLEELAGL